MERCFRCGISSERVPLYDAISDKEIVKICESCSIREHMPVIKRVEYSEKPEKMPTVRERLSYMSGINPKEKERITKSNEEDKKLRELANKRYKEEIASSNAKPDTAGEGGLVRNFHWIIMRARRSRHMTQKQLADMISEPEEAIKMAERGVLPRERERLVKKIETVLKIRISSLPEVPKVLPEPTPTEEIPEETEDEDFDLKSKENKWTIMDLIRFGRKKKKKPEEEDAENPETEELEFKREVSDK